MAASYAIWHGPEGLVEIASQINALTTGFAKALGKAGYEILNSNYFDTLSINTRGKTDALIQAAEKHNILLRKIDDTTLVISF